MKPVLYLSVLIVINSCSLPQNHLGHYITASETSCKIPVEGTIKDISVDSDCNWDLVADNPKWCSVQVISSNGKKHIELDISPNDNEADRSCEISLQYGEVCEKIKIVQDGRPYFHTLPMNGYVRIDKHNSYMTIYAIRMAINQANYAKIFPGNIIYKNATSLNSLKSVEWSALKPVTISAFVRGQSYISEGLPSLELTNRLAQEIIHSSSLISNMNLYTASPVQYTSLKQLDAIGMGNLGIPFSELTGRSKDDKMEKRLGLIYSYSFDLFDIVMDYQQQPELVESPNNEIVIINNISYGRSAILIIEADCARTDAIAIIDEYMKTGICELQNNKIIPTIQSWLISFNQDGTTSVTNGSIELIKSYVDSSSDSDIHPINFTVSNYPDWSTGNIIYKLPL